MSKTPQSKRPRGKDATGSAARARPSRARGIATLLAGFIVSLLVSKGFEIVTKSETYRDGVEAVTGTIYAELLEVQESWRQFVGCSAPLALATTYWDDLWYIYDRGPAATFPDRDGSTGSVSPCTAHAAGAGWTPEDRQMSTEKVIVPFQDTTTLSLAPERDSMNFEFVLVPFLALIRTFLQLTSEGGWSYLWISLQIAMGVPAFMLAFAYLESTPTETRYFPENVAARIILVPAGVVVAASVLAFGLKYLMLGGLMALGWFTGLSGACCGATGVAGFYFWCTHKFAEYQVSGAVQRKVQF